MRPNPVLPMLLAWLVPGTGHLKIGRTWPGLFVFLAIVPLYVGGMALAGYENVSWVRHPIYFWAAHVWGGVLTGAAAFATRHVETSGGPDKSVGELFTAIACLLNVIAIADVWSRCSFGDPEERAAARAAAKAASPSPVAATQSPDAPPAPPSGEATLG